MVLTLTLTSFAATASAQPGDTLGVYAGAGSPTGVAAFESKLGRDVSVVHDTLARENWGTLTDVRWWLDQWATSKYAGRVIYTVPMLPDSGGSLAEGASGAFNDQFRLLALKLVAGGQGGATLRIGPEFNGNWFRWNILVPNGAADFAAYWRQIVNTMRAVPGAHFKFDWCPNDGSSYANGQPVDAAAAWPGDAYVDYVGLDVYDQSWSPNRADPAARWNEFLTQPNGLRWHRDFAAAHGKPMTFPEWGLANRTDGYGGGDTPYFIEQMYEWIRTNNVAYHMYFEYADSNADYKIFAGTMPNSARRFVELFGPGATGASLSSLNGGGTAGSTAVATAKKKVKKVAKRCVTRTLKVHGKVVRKHGKVVKKTVCVKKAAKKSSRKKVSKKLGPPKRSPVRATPTTSAA